MFFFSNKTYFVEQLITGIPIRMQLLIFRSQKSPYRDKILISSDYTEKRSVNFLFLGTISRQKIYLQQFDIVSYIRGILFEFVHLFRAIQS